MPYELFLSYSRKDNLTRPLPATPHSTIPNPQAKGWVTALRDEILADHRRFSTEPLRIFFDTSEIRDMDDWRHRILTGLRESKILLVCLSPDYFKSPPCLWEWEEYLKRQVHALMGHDSVAPVYFVEAPNSDEQLNAAWAEAVGRKVVTPADRPAWEKKWKAWHEATLDRPNRVDLKPWFPQGVEALRETAVREKLAALGTSLWERIQRARRATSVPGNLRRLNPHFIGRRTELRQLHENLALGAVGVVTAVYGLGGQGKTELATAYAHGWADCYPAGLWVLGAEGKNEILPLLGELCVELSIPLTTGPDETADVRGRRVLAELKLRATEAAARDPDKGAACLVILDNVSEPALLAEPQLAHIPREDWLRVVATTREGPEKFPASRQKSLAFIAVDALADDDAARLIEDRQPDAQWPAATAAGDATAARALARELGGFTLAVESVAIYLGLHPDIRPADYLARLRAEGLPSVDALPADADVAAQMQHREKQLRLVLDQTLARLTSSERTALDYAALLPPDGIPWPWLRALVEQEHPDAIAVRPGYPDPWPALRRRLEGLRLLTPGDHVEIARLHRMVAAHVRERLAMRREEILRRLRDKIEDIAIALQDDIEHNPAAHVWQVAPLQDAVRYWRAGEQDPALGHIAGVVGDIEARIGRLDVAFHYLWIANEILERTLAADPRSEFATRDVSVSLSKLGDFLASRGMPGDAEKALGHYERCLEISERLLVANPERVQTARDVSVFLERLGDFLASRGRPGDADKALGHYERSLEVRERLLVANPESAQASRDVSASLERFGGFLASRAMPGDAEKALGHYEQSLEISERLLVANPESAQAARDVSLSLNKLGDILASRGLPGDSEKALGHYERSLEIRERLLVANPESALAVRDVYVSMWSVGDFLEKRGQPGDADKALKHFDRCLKVSERLQVANPQSSQAARDVMLSLERMAAFEGGRVGGENNALELQARALAIALKLCEGDPQSVFYGCTAAVSYIRMYQRAQAAGQAQLANQCLKGCFSVLDPLVQAGVELDPPMRQLHAQLAPMFSQS